MGPCLYCHKMIYHPGMAERGYHRSCHDEANAQYTRSQAANERHDREHEKRRLRKAAKRQAEKALAR